MNKGALIAGFSSISIGFSAVVASETTKLVHPLIITLLVYSLSVVFLFVLAKTIGERFQFRELIRDFKKPLAEVVLSRCILGQLILLVGFSMTIAVRAVFMLGFEPVFVLLYSTLFLRERVTPRKLGLIGLLLFGGFIFITNLNPSIFQEIMPGDALIILALAFLAYSYLPSSRISKKINPSTITIASNAISAVILVPVVVLIMPLGLVGIGGLELSYIVAYAMLFFVSGTFLWFKSLTSTKPWIVSSVLALVPVSGAFLALIWLGQWITHIQLIGALIMIATTYFIAKESGYG